MKTITLKEPLSFDAALRRLREPKTTCVGIRPEGNEYYLTIDFIDNLVWNTGRIEIPAITFLGRFFLVCKEIFYKVPDTTPKIKKPAMREKQSSFCRRCEKNVRTYIPKGGDGSACFFVRHRDKNGKPCFGSYDMSTEDQEAEKRRYGR